MKKKEVKFWNMLAEGYSRKEAQMELHLDPEEVNEWFKGIIAFYNDFNKYNQ